MKSEKTGLSKKRATLVYIVLGTLALIYAAVDKFFLHDIDNLGVAVPVGLMFIVLSQSEAIALKLGRKGLVILLIFGVILFLLGLVVYFIYK